MEEDGEKNTSTCEKDVYINPSNYQRPPSSRSIRQQHLQLRRSEAKRSELCVIHETERQEIDATSLEINRNNPLDLEEQFPSSSCQQTLITSQSVDALSDQLPSDDENGDVIEDSLLSIDFPFSSSCIECVKPCRVSDRSDISEGDHIIIFGALYDHHAIVTKISPDENDTDNEKKAKLTLIHATNTRLRSLTGTSISGNKAKIRQTSQNHDFERNNTMVVKYLKSLYSPSEIVGRAERELEEQTFKYNLFANNCEHFATYCVTNERFSVQVKKLRMTLMMFLTRRFAGLSDEKQRNKVAFERGLLCKPCFERNDKLLAAEKKPILRRSDVSEGDIITFSHWKLHHDAVIVKVHGTNAESQIDLTIVHYAFGGIFKHNTITEERKTFSLNGSVKVTVYNSPPYNVYSREETIERARSRIGEQQFSFFANDSSHFARWSKLKLNQSAN